MVENNLIERLETDVQFLQYFLCSDNTPRNWWIL